MGKKVEIVVEKTGEEGERGALYEATRKMVLASMGMMALAQEEMEQFINKMVERGALYEATRKMVLASMGMMALAQEEMEQFINKMVERGELAEKEGKKLVREVMDKRKKQTEKAENELEKRMEELLARMNVPSKSDIDALSAKIVALTKKVDELKKES